MSYLKISVLAGIGALLVALISLGGVYIFHMNNRPDLQPWHTTLLPGEFSADLLEHSFSFEDYRRVEERLFDELDKAIVSDSSGQRQDELNRYARGSWSDPQRGQVNWNKTFEMAVKAPKAMVLMLHGLSDSPYSMRALAETLHLHGGWVLGLRLPGHGTIPAALTGITGFKPTAERIPREGVYPLSPSLDSVGPLGHSVSCCAIIDDVIAATGASGPQDMGKVMGQLKGKLAGRADMGAASALVKQKLVG